MASYGSLYAPQGHGAQAYGSPYGHGASQAYGPPEKYHYAGADNAKRNLEMKQRRSTFNVVGFHMSLLLPWALFVFVSSVMTWKLRFHASMVCWIFAIAVLVVVVLCGAAAYIGFRNRRAGIPGYEPTWLVFIFVTSLMAWILAVCSSNYNYWENIQGYYDVVNLGTYQDVNVATTRGAQVMDAGYMNFTAGTRVDTSKAQGFKNLDNYCVAPIVVGDAPLATYDFWAVGVNCCDEVAKTFTCGEANNPRARGGLRFMRDEQRPFLRLAVQQAMSTYNIRAVHPLFFVYTEAQADAADLRRSQGIQFFVLCMYGHFLLQLILVTIASCVLNKVKFAL